MIFAGDIFGMILAGLLTWHDSCKVFVLAYTLQANTIGTEHAGNSMLAHSLLIIFYLV